MPVEILTQVRFVATSGKTEDDITNSWHFRVETVPAPPATLTAIQTALSAFYNAVSPSLVNDFSTTAVIKHYDMGQPKPRVPIVSNTMTVSPYGSAGLAIPRETAIVLSFHGAPISGSPLGRRRGRIYLWAPTNGSLDNAGRFAGSLVTTVKNAGNALLTASDAAADWTWVVWSRVNGTSVPVYAGHVDNAPDTQRRRGLDSTSRQVFP